MKEPRSEDFEVKKSAFKTHGQKFQFTVWNNGKPLKCSEKGRDLPQTMLEFLRWRTTISLRSIISWTLVSVGKSGESFVGL